MEKSLKSVMSAEELSSFLSSVFPQVASRITILAVEGDILTISLKTGEEDLRPGGTISGPTMFMLADVAFYLAVLSLIGPEALTVTTNCSINFMRKPEMGQMLAKARVIKLGKTLAVGDVELFNEGQEGMVAHATMTYAIPPKRAK